MSTEETEYGPVQWLEKQFEIHWLLYGEIHNMSDIYRDNSEMTGLTRFYCQPQTSVHVRMMMTIMSDHPDICCECQGRLI